MNLVPYLEMLKETFDDDTHPGEWFQQDGATVYDAAEVMDWSKGRFPRRLISHRLDFLWRSRSPDLSHQDFYL